MPNIEYNQFFIWESQDDIISQSWSIIEWDNIDWIKTWYWATIWPKMTNQLTTWVNAMRWFYDRSSDPADNWVFWDNWTIYNTDWTLLWTLTNTAYDITACFRNWSNYYFVSVFEIETWNSWIKIWSISVIDAGNWDWVNMVDTWWSWLWWNDGPPPVLEVSNSLTYIWEKYWVIRVLSWVQTSYTFVDSIVVWLTLHWTQYKVYSQTWSVYYWDWTSASFSSAQDVWFRIERVSQYWNFDYITTEDWDLYISWGYDYQLISNKKTSNRLSDNSTYTTKFDFNNEIWTNIAITFARWDVYILSSDTNVWLYKYWSVIPWWPKWFHKIITKTNDWTQIDEIYSLFMHSRSNRLYMSYRAWATYWVDYIDITANTTAQDWFLVTPIFRWPPNKENKITEVRATSSYTSWNNYIKIYKRINNGSWVLIRNINDTTDTIKRHKIWTNNGTWNLSDEFIDIQFKIEIHNDLQTDTPPIIHWLELIYSINWN